MAEQADAPALKAGGQQSRVSSNLTMPTTFEIPFGCGVVVSKETYDKWLTNLAVKLSPSDHVCNFAGIKIRSSWCMPKDCIAVVNHDGSIQKIYRLTS